MRNPDDLLLNAASISDAKNRLVAAASPEFPGVVIVAGADSRICCFSPEAARDASKLRSYLWVRAEASECGSRVAVRRIDAGRVAAILERMGAQPGPTDCDVMEHADSYPEALGAALRDQSSDNSIISIESAIRDSRPSIRASDAAMLVRSICSLDRPSGSSFSMRAIILMRRPPS